MTSQPSPFYTEPDLPLREHAPGAMQPVLQGKNFSAVVLHPTPDIRVREHTHDQEVLGIVMEGYLDLVVDGMARRVEAPGFYHIRPGVAHSASGGVGCVVEVFAPVRPDLA